MSRHAFLREESASFPLIHCLPLTPASLLFKEKKLINFCSRDYLGLSQHAEMRKNGIKYVLHYGTGTCDPEIKNGYLECQKHVEEKYAEALSLTKVHLFASHSAALSSILQQFPHQEWTLFLDAACQASLRKAAALWGGTCVLYPHRNLQALDALLAAYPSSNRILLSESLFAATGHISDLEALIHLSKKQDAFLIIDDSCAFGLKGKQGFGLVQGLGVDFVVCALDHAAGASGAFAGSALDFFKTPCLIREELLSFCALGAIEAALELIPSLEGERMQLEQRTHWVRQQLKTGELSLFPSSSHLIAILCDTAADALQRYDSLLELGILSEVSILSSEEAYLLFAINAYHSPDELSMLVKGLSLKDATA
jgi:8-amino-7-oxononanoate synthase